jgi:serine phosphatase RsbU (regulator of sigma subunit)
MEWIFVTIMTLFHQLAALISGVGLMTVLMHLAIIRRSRKYHGDYHRLQEHEKQSREVLIHRNMLQDQTRNYKQSLNYAQRIQRAMFITPKQLRLLFPESFIYQRPKDIVSGDFNWARQINGKVFFSVADCTGHGVPGAFMSLLGLEFFRQITAGREDLDPATILNEMNKHFDIVFGDTEELSLKDGIDLALCAYDHRKQVLEYAGAFNPVYIVRDQEIMEIKGDRIIVGADYGMQRGTFKNRTLEIKKADMLYMFTDGYADQFGGPEGKKFKYRRFRHLLMSIHQLPMEQQKAKLYENMKEWMGNQHEQIDDQTVIGIRPASFSSY